MATTATAIDIMKRVAQLLPFTPFLHLKTQVQHEVARVGNRENDFKHCSCDKSNLDMELRTV